MPPGRLARHLPTTLGLGAAAIRMDKLIGLYQAHQAEASAILASYTRSRCASNAAAVSGPGQPSNR